MWFKDYDHYWKASEMAPESKEMQIAYLRLCLEPEVRAQAKIHTTKDYDKAMAALNKLCFEDINPMVIRQIQLFKMTDQIRNSFPSRDRIESLLMLVW